MEKQIIACSYTSPGCLYTLILAGLLLDCSSFAHSSSNDTRSNRFKTSGGSRVQIFPESVPGLRGSVSQIYQKDSPHRPADCDDECIHKLRINKSLSFQDLRTRSEKLPGWGGKINPGYFIRSMAAEWYVTFVVGTPQENYREQKVQMCLDTGSSFTWFQCKPCRKCFPQLIRLFDKEKSTSYRNMNQNDPYCQIVQSWEGQIGQGSSSEYCYYGSAYADRTRSLGYVASDTFKLENMNDRGNLVPLTLGFGCGWSNRAEIQGGSGGILGLANSRAGLSFPEQFPTVLGSEYSFCLTGLNEPANSGYIIFGQASRPTTDSFASTSFIYTNYPHFYVDLVDLSVNGQLLNVPEGAFAKDNNGYGGAILDSGTPYSLVTEVVYNLMVQKLTKVFDQLGDPYYPDNRRGMGPCWGVKDLDATTFPFPRIAWHFRDGNTLELSTSGTYVIYKTRSRLLSLCVPFLKNTNSPGSGTTPWTIIGGHSQINTLMYFDQPNQRLGWIYGAC
ncbi:hypothetical protein Mapa_006126 [Marchantia paleacea]|nr:hypothetical protein Mapa_006126 [Marchantia paleacea]